MTTMLGIAHGLRRNQLGHLVNVCDRDGETVRRPWRRGTVDGAKRCTGGETRRTGSIPYASEEERNTVGNWSPPPRRKLEREASLGRRSGVRMGTCRVRNAFESFRWW